MFAVMKKNGQAPLLDATCLYMLNVYAAVLEKKYVARYFAHV